MLEDQEYILKKVLKIIDDEKPDGVMIAGDVYDKSVPSAQAVEMLDSFLVSLAQKGVEVFLISGNHDSPERLAFGGRLMEKSGIHISPVYDGKVEPVSLVDEHGKVNIYMLPFIKPAHVRAVFPDEEIESYTDAVRKAVSEMEPDQEARNVLIAHMFVTGAERTDSEDVSIGGADNVDASVFGCFDYVALGHLHRPQNVAVAGTAQVRYCGTPLKYSFSETDDEKSVTVVEIGAKEGNMVDINTILVPLEPMRDMVRIRGSYDELTQKSFYEGTSLTDDYVHITLTDEDDVIDAAAKLRVIYRNLMELRYDNTRTRSDSRLAEIEKIEEKTPIELFGDLFEKQNGRPMTDEQSGFIAGLIEKIWEDEE